MEPTTQQPRALHAPGTYMNENLSLMNQRTSVPLARLSPAYELWGQACPVPGCGGCSEILDVHRTSWGVCHRHRMSWCVGKNPRYFDASEDSDEQSQYAENMRTLESYAEVSPDRWAVPHLPRDIEAALDSILETFWLDGAKDYLEAGMPRSRHVFRDMHTIDRWMKWGGGRRSELYRESASSEPQTAETLAGVNEWPDALPDTNGQGSFCGVGIPTDESEWPPDP